MKRPDVTVRTRHSVVERTPEEQMKDRVLANVFHRDENARLPIAVTSKPAVELKKGRFRTHVEVRIPIRHIVLLPRGQEMQGTVSLFTVSTDPAGAFSEIVRQRREIEIPKEKFEQEAASALSYEFDVETSGPDARISIAVWDETGGEAGFRLIRPASR